MERIGNEDYYIVRHTFRARIFYPKNYISPPGAVGPPSDKPNSEYSEKALGDPARVQEIDPDYHLDKEPEPEQDPAMTTVDSSSDTSLVDKVTSTASAISHQKPRNEIFYLQVLLNGETRIVRKPGRHPIVCYVDSSTCTSKPGGISSAGHVTGIEHSLPKLKIKEERKSVTGRGQEDDFFMEG